MEEKNGKIKQPRNAAKGDTAAMTKKIKKRKPGKKERLEKRKSKETTENAKRREAEKRSVAVPRKFQARRAHGTAEHVAESSDRWFNHENAQRQKPLVKGVIQADEDTQESIKQETDLLLSKLVEDVEKEQKQRK